MVIAGTDFGLIMDGAKQIDRLFDWQNQLDISAGRPRSSETYTDPDDGTNYIIHCMTRDRLIKYPIMDTKGTIICHLGGQYQIEYGTL
jgi:hypothetical protein